MDHPIEAMKLEDLGDCRSVLELLGIKDEIRIGLQDLQPAFLKFDIVVIVDIVDTYDAMAQAQTTLGKMEADEARCAGDKYSFHERYDDVGPIAACHLPNLRLRRIQLFSVVRL